MNRIKIDSSNVFNIYDIDLNDPSHLKVCLQQWDTIQTLSEKHLKVKDLFMELEDKWNKTPLTDIHKQSINLYLIEGYTQREAGEKIGIGTRAVAKAVGEGIDMMISTGDKNDR